MRPLWLFASKPYFERLVKRFDLRQAQQTPEDYRVTTTIQPVTQADDLLKELKIVELAIGAFPAVSGWQTLFTVPAGKRWILRALEVNSASGAFTIEQPSISDGTARVEIEKLTAGTVFVTTAQGQHIELKEGWIIECYANVTTAGNGYATALIEEMDSY